MSVVLFLLLLGVTFNGYSQVSAPSGFFVGKRKAVPKEVVQGKRPGEKLTRWIAPTGLVALA